MSWRSCSAADASSSGGRCARVEVGHDRPIVDLVLVVLVIVVVVIVVFLGVGTLHLELGQEVVALLGRDVDRGRQAIVADIDETVVAFQLERDRLD